MVRIPFSFLWSLETSQQCYRRNYELALDDVVLNGANSLGYYSIVNGSKLTLVAKAVTLACPAVVRADEEPRDSLNRELEGIMSRERILFPKSRDSSLPTDSYDFNWSVELSG